MHDYFGSFLNQAGLQDFDITFLAGDASPRKYYRIKTPNQTYVLMDSPLIDSNRQFSAIASLLTTAGFSAPQVIRSTPELMLLEDLGDTTLTYVRRHFPEKQEKLYNLATQTTITLSQSITEKPDCIPTYTLDIFLDGVTTFLDWYYPEVHGHEAPPAVRESFITLWTRLYHEFQTLPKGLMLRDFHVDNLVYLEDRSGHQACGLLDFQDACWGPAVYDFVSLIDDVRVDLPDSLIQACWASYGSAFPDLDKSLAQKLSISRLTRILGVFMRLAKRDGKPHYLTHIPRIWKIIERNFKNPDLKEIKGWFDNHMKRRLVPPINQAMILAAGLGKRLHPLTLTTPKPLINLKGKPLIQHALDRLQSMNIPKIIVNTHYLADQIHAYLDDKNVIISHEQDLLETGGGVLNALPHFDHAPILCLNSDIWWHEDQGHILADLEATWDDSTMDVLLVLIHKKNTLNFSGSGDFTWDQITLTPQFREQETAPYVYTGIQILHPRAFDGQTSGTFSLVDTYRKAASTNRLKAIVLDGQWSDVGTPEALENLRTTGLPPSSPVRG